jgi:hypothetical protein
VSFNILNRLLCNSENNSHLIAQKNYWIQDSACNWIRVLDRMREYSNRQIRRKIYREDTGLACASRAYLWREGRRIGDVFQIIESENSETAIDIHTAYDLFMEERID